MSAIDKRRESFAHVNGLFAPMRLIDARKLQAFGAIPTFDAAMENGLLIDYPTDPVARSRSLIVFVSHRWLRGDAVLPHPDNAQGVKFALLLEAVTILRAPFVSRGEPVDVLFWIDYCSISSTDRARVSAILSLPGIMERCDVMLYPVLANDKYTTQERKYWKKHSTRRFLEEVSRALDHDSGDFLSEYIHCQELFSRAWVRLETLLGTVIPLAPECIRWLQKNGGTRSDRPLVLCAPEQRAVVLPRISRKIMHAFDPSRGDLSQRNDSMLIDQIKSSTLASYSFAKLDEKDFNVPGLRGARASVASVGLGSSTALLRNSMSLAQIDEPHSSSSYDMSSSSTETRNSLETSPVKPTDPVHEPVHPGYGHRRNISRFVSDFVGPEEPQNDVSRELIGRRTEGDSNQQEQKRKGEKRSTKSSKSSSSKPKSEKKSKKKSKSKSASGTTSSSKSSKSRLKNGHGSVLLSNGHRYSGQWKNGMIHGQGQFRYEDGGVFEGTYHKGKPHGPGKFTDATGKVEIQRWENGVLMELEQLAAPPLEEVAGRDELSHSRKSSVVAQRLNSLRSTASKRNLLVSRHRRQSSAGRSVDGSSCTVM